MLVVAPQEYVNIYSTLRPAGGSGHSTLDTRGEAHIGDSAWGDDDVTPTLRH